MFYRLWVRKLHLGPFNLIPLRFQPDVFVLNVSECGLQLNGGQVLSFRLAESA